MLSIPQVTKLQFDLSGSRHLICVEDEAIEIVYTRMAELKRIPENLQILQTGATVISRKDLKVEQFDSVRNLKDRLREILDRAMMGMRFYGVGSERFVWDLNRCARSFGLSEEEISLETSDRGSKNIYCANCQTINCVDNTDVFTCYSCGTKLEVLEHFSR
ncbi:hypothetical protein IQ255_19170 [Pleurocapsales cyanobacterium LEGE 10410]|nr:hypothetical protein [Pleurocapsales cyanobacterium LEGE 10410]